MAALRAEGVVGAIIGKAWYEGRIDLGELLQRYPQDGGDARTQIETAGPRPPPAARPPCGANDRSRAGLRRYHPGAGWRRSFASGAACCRRAPTPPACCAPATRRSAGKWGEEATEVITAAGGAELAAESADLIYHLLVLLAAEEVPVAEVLRILAARAGAPRR